MKKLQDNSLFTKWAVALLLVLLLASACVQNETPTVTPAPPDPTPDVADTPTEPAAPAPPGQDSGYPGVAAENDSGYPGPPVLELDLLDTPPDPERELPAAEATTGVIGGVLIWKVMDEGFQPLRPVALRLAEVIRNSNDEAALIRDSSTSPQAELFPTGIFIFRNVPPGVYGLVIDVGYSKFPVNDESGAARLIEIEAGQVIDLGQVITELPGS